MMTEMEPLYDKKESNIKKIAQLNQNITTNQTGTKINISEDDSEANRLKDNINIQKERIRQNNQEKRDNIQEIKNIESSAPTLTKWALTDSDKKRISELRSKNNQLDSDNLKARNEISEITKKLNENTEKSAQNSNSNRKVNQDNESEILMLEQENRNIDENIRILSKGVKVYKIASIFQTDSDDMFFKIESCKKATVVPKQCLNDVANYWFGSTSILLALIGSLFYWGHLIYINRNNEEKDSVRTLFINFYNSTIVAFFKYIRNALIGFGQLFSLNQNFKDKPAPTFRGWLRRRMQRYFSDHHKLMGEKISHWKNKPPRIKYVEKKVIVHVDKEVVVEKEVEKEIIRKELVHVPLYTNDPSKIKYPEYEAMDKAEEKIKSKTEKEFDKSVEKDIRANKKKNK